MTDVLIQEQPLAPTWHGRELADLDHDELVAVILEQNAAMTRAIALNKQAAARIAELNEALSGKPKIFTGH